MPFATEKEYVLKQLFRLTMLAVLVTACSGIFLTAQSNDRIDELLQQDQARLDATAYIVLAAGKLIEETDGPEKAMEMVKSLGLVTPDALPESPVMVQDLSYLLMKSLDLKGGIMYAIFPGPRYAYRDMVYKQAVNDSGGPLRIVSGEEVIRSLGYATALKEGPK